MMTAPVETADLVSVRQWARRVPSASWCTALGAPLTPSEVDEARAFVSALSFGKLDVAPVTSWTAAAQIISDPNWDQRWWNKEEQERNALKHELTRDIPEQVLLSAVTEVTNAASRIAHGCAAIAAGRDRLADEAMPRAAAGAATQACYFKALAIAAGKPAEHPFHLKYGLFAAGRWPLGIADGRFHIF